MVQERVRGYTRSAPLGPQAMGDLRFVHAFFAVIALIQPVATRCNLLQHGATCCNTVQPVATQNNLLQRTLQHVVGAFFP
jgi:hypothetical protein